MLAQPLLQASCLPTLGLEQLNLFLQLLILQLHFMQATDQQLHLFLKALLVRSQFSDGIVLQLAVLHLRCQSHFQPRILLAQGGELCRNGHSSFLAGRLCIRQRLGTGFRLLGDLGHLGNTLLQGLNLSLLGLQLALRSVQRGLEPLTVLGRCPKVLFKLVDFGNVLIDSHILLADSSGISFKPTYGAVQLPCFLTQHLFSSFGCLLVLLNFCLHLLYLPIVVLRLLLERKVLVVKVINSAEHSS
mmetsp:Transcript_82596/g.220814  ORF Transcript_82596/g.220814 Transcript_82596/m.220814 type:complete len:245 (+) Transcript_82596:1256-1990(+)